MTVITESNIRQIIACEPVVMIDFWATWCGPCRMLSPTVDEIASSYEGRVLVGKCNVDDASEVAMQYGIMSIPTLLFFKDGKLADKSIGLVSREEIEQRLSKLLQ